MCLSVVAVLFQMNIKRVAPTAAVVVAVQLGNILVVVYTVVQFTVVV